MANDAFCELVGADKGEVLNTFNYPVPDEQKAEFFRVDDEVFTTGLPHENEEVVSTSRGDVRIILTRKCLVQLMTSEGERPFILASTTDVTRFREAEARAQYLANHDPLTGIANREQLANRMDDVFNSTTSSDKRAAVFMLDLDGFKMINDQYGHMVGDDVLKVVAKRLLALVRTDDTVARIGGDEFCILQRVGKQPTGAFALAWRIKESLSQPITFANQHIKISVSIGIAVFPFDGDAPEILMQRADMALYEVKHDGRNGYRRFNENEGSLNSDRQDA